MDCFKRFPLLILVGVLASTAVVSVLGDCIHYSRDYAIGTYKVTFDEALYLCLQYGMELASPLTRSEENALIAAFKAENPGVGYMNGVWIGARKVSDYGIGNYTWITTGKPVIATRFLSGFADNTGGKEDCLQLVKDNINGASNYGWNDLTCNIKIAFACQTKCC